MTYLDTKDLIALAQDFETLDSTDSQFYSLDSSTSSKYLQAWYTIMLRQTLEYAEQAVPYYRERASLSGISANSFEQIYDLSKYPVLTRSDFVKHYVSFLSEKVLADRACSTSGTTGKRLLIYGNSDEENASASIRQILLAKQMSQSQPLTMRVIPGNRRTHISVGSPNLRANTITIGYSPAYASSWFDSADHLIEVLSDTYYLGCGPSRISLLHITPPVVLDMITANLLNRDVDPSIFGITDIVVSGAFLSSQTRHLVENVWKAQIHHSYSCSEIRGEAISIKNSPDCFSVQKTMLCEILDVDTYEPVRPFESGLVVLTSLYPFQQMMPLIRYSMGDIAQHCGIQNVPFVTALRPIGRVGECINLGSRQFIGSRDGFQAVTSFRDIPQIPYPRFELRRDDSDSSLLLIDVEVMLPEHGRSETTEEGVALKVLQEIGCYGYSGDSLPTRAICRFLPKNSLSLFPKIMPER